MKNIGAILLYIWFIPFQIVMLLIAIIGALPIWLFKWDSILLFRKNEKQWKITKIIENLSDWLEVSNRLG